MIEDFISEFKRLSHAYESWGRFVASEIFAATKAGERDKDKFFKIPVHYRLKKENSIRSKVLIHGLTNLQKDVRDLFGVRFVVLLSSEVRLVESAIKENIYWESEKVRDFGVESAGAADSFDYQSVHYIITCRNEFLRDGITIPSGVCCEVQIRTMLQHAYAELTHDNIYKPSQLVPYEAKRLVARSMALMETTDMIFCQTLDELKKENLPRNEVFNILKEIYLEKIDNDESSFDQRINFEIIDFAKEKINLKNSKSKILDFWGDQNEFYEKIKDHRETSLLLRQPVALLLYWLVATNDRFLKKKWPFESMKEDMRKIFSDSGVALGDRL
jgi:putative GTP pyrophosphokinase